MDNDQYNKCITDFHAQLTLRVLVSDSENRNSRNMRDVPDMLQEYITSFNSTVAKPFLEQINSRIKSSSQFSLYPEQFQISKDGETALKNLVIKDAEKFNDAIYSSLQKYDRITKEKDINPKILKVGIDAIKNDIEGSIYFIARDFNEYISKDDSKNYEFAKNFISVFYPLSRNKIETFKDVLPDFDQQLEKFLVNKDPEGGLNKAKLATSIFEDIDRQQRRPQIK